MDFGLTSNGNTVYCSISPPRLIREEMRGEERKKKRWEDSDEEIWEETDE